MRRTGPKGSGEFTRVRWDEALDDITGWLRDIASTTGPAVILPYSYLGTQGLLQGKSVENHFFDRLGATRLVRKVCTGTDGGGVTATVGTTVGMVPGDIVHSRFIVLWGTNTVVTNLHLWPLIREAKAQGATVVVIDPARPRNAQAADCTSSRGRAPTLRWRSG